MSLLLSALGMAFKGYCAYTGISKLTQTITGGLKSIVKLKDIFVGKPIANNPSQFPGLPPSLLGLSPAELEKLVDKILAQQKEVEEKRLEGMEEAQQRAFQQQRKLQRAEILAQRHLLVQQQRFLTMESEKSRDFIQQENVLNRLLQQTMQQKSLDFQKSENEFNRDLQAYMFYVQQVNQRWPLLIDPMEYVEQNLYFTKYYQDGIPALANQTDSITPLKVIVTHCESQHSPIEDAQCPIIDNSDLADDRLFQFISSNYKLDSDINPVEFLDGAWNPKSCHGGAAIHNIFNIMRRTPTLILETRQCGDFIELAFAYWNGILSTYTYQHVLRIDFPRLVASIVRQQTEKLQAELKEETENHAFSYFQYEYQTNIDIYNAEKKCNDTDVLSQMLYRNYVTTDTVRQQIQDTLGYVQTFFVGLFADLHHLYYNIAPPMLPQYIDDFYKKLEHVIGLPGCGFPKIQDVCAIYANTFENMLQEQGDENSNIIKLYYAQTMASFGELDGAYKLLNNVTSDICDKLELGRTTVGDDKEQARMNVPPLLDCKKLEQFEDIIIPLKQCSKNLGIPLKQCSENL